MKFPIPMLRLAAAAFNPGERLMASPMRPTLAVLAALLLPVEAFAQVAACTPPEEAAISQRDRDRIAGLEDARLRGLAAALTSQSAEDRQTVSGIYSNALAPVDELPEGDYHCRTIKLGGISPLVVYQFFDCSIEATDDGYAISKPTGSQRFSGTLTASGDGYFYRGALYYSDESPIAYDGASERDQVGCLYRVSADGSSYALELPSPQFESFHDIILLLPKQ